MDCKFFPNCVNTATQCKKTHPVCPHFLKPQGCRYAANFCKFTHPSCTYFAKGYCTKGDQCRFSHKNKKSPPSYPTSSKGAPPPYSVSTTTATSSSTWREKQHIQPSSSSSSTWREKQHNQPSSSSCSPSSTSVISSRKVAERTERNPFEVSFLIDVSSSMNGDAIQHCKTALKDITSIMRPQDKIEIHTFSHIQTQVLPLGSKQSHGQGNINRVINNITASGGTALWDSTAAVIQSIREHKQKSGNNKVVRKLFILTDGSDQHSTSRWKDCARAVQSPGLTLEIFLVAVVKHIDPVSQQELADLGGGKSFYKYKAIADVGDILEGFRFFKETMFLEETIQKRQTAMVAKQVTTVKMVPKTTVHTRTRRTQISSRH